MKHFGLKILVICAPLAFIISCSKNDSSCNYKILNVHLGQFFIDSLAPASLKSNRGTNVFTYNNTEIKVDFFSYRTFQGSSWILSQNETECFRTDFTGDVNFEERISKSTDLPITITETRRTSFAGIKDTAELKTLGELMEISVNYNKFSIPKDSTDSIHGRFYETISLGQNTYDSVYLCFRQNVSYKDRQKIVLYYKFGWGVLAFSFNENELWIRK